MNKIIKTLTVVFLLVMSSLSYALTSEENLIQKSFLVVSALECSVLTEDEKEHERLFMLGYNNAKQFYETIKSDPAIYPKVKQKVPMILLESGGPTTDFIIGYVYAGLTSDTYKKLGSETTLWSALKANMYREKNCLLIK